MTDNVANRPRKAFICHASEDKELARRIATALTSNGISTFFDEWEIRAGDSIRVKIEEGLIDCTHFVVLLTPRSIEKPWVNAEIDSGFLRRIEGVSKFIPLRFELKHSQVPDLLRPLRSLEIDESQFAENVNTLVGDIYDVSRKPPLGTKSGLLDESVVRQSGRSQIALQIAKYFVDNSTDGYLSPQLNVRELTAALQASKEDVADGLHELESIRAIDLHKVMNGTENHHVAPGLGLFARFDRYWKPWNPDDDVLQVASILLSETGKGFPTRAIAESLGWDVRRLNPALAIVVLRRLATFGNEKSHPEIRSWLQSNDDTRRFVKSRM